MTESTFFKAGPEFVQFVLSYRHTAFRLEVRDNYADSDEVEHVRRLLAGEPDDDSWMDDWIGMILRRTLDGQRIERVRVVSEPWSDYTRFGLHLSRLNAAAGEDIRYMSRDRAVELELPDYDYWLIDAHKMCILRFDENDGLLGADVVTEPETVVEHCHYREIARHHATPREDYIRQHESNR